MAVENVSKRRSLDNVNGQGQSLCTLDKERRIGSALSIGMRVVGNKWPGQGYRYYHCDTNSGCGWNYAARVIGTPLVFWQTADLYLKTVTPEAFFCDTNLSTIVSLKRRLSDEPRWWTSTYLFNTDNDEMLPVFAEYIEANDNPSHAVGSIIVDPNGWFYKNGKSGSAPVKTLSWFSSRFPKIDIILNLNYRTYAMQKERGHQVLSPYQVLNSLNKKHWLVAKTTVGQGRFLLAIGRNFPTGDHKALGIYSITSDDGKAIMAKAEGGQE